MKDNLRVDSIGLCLVAIESHDRELLHSPLETCYIGRKGSAYSLDLAGVNLNDTDTAGNELLSQALSEAADSGLGSTVDTTARVGLSTGNGADVDDVTVAAIRTGEEDGENGLGHVDEAGDVCLEHDVDVLLGNLRSASNALDKTTVYMLVDVLLN